jgi:hypothetical protein
MSDTISTYDDARQWRDRAEEMRAVADGMQNEHNKNIALRLAADYDRLATHAERRARRSLERVAQAPFPRLGLA